MANSFTPTQSAQVAIALANKDMVLGGLVHRDFESNFGPGQGATVNVRVPGALPARTRGLFDNSTPITTDEVNEQTIPVTLDTHAYSAVGLSEGDQDLAIGDFGTQVLYPQVKAVAAFCERAVATAMTATPETTNIAFDAADPAKTFTAIRTRLRANGVSSDAPLFAVVGVNVMAALLDGPAGTRDADGKVRGFEVHESNRIGADDVIGFVKEAFALTVRAPKVPDGASGKGASIAESGFALRHLMDYNSGVASDRSMVSTFVGCKAMPLAVVDETDGTVDLVANGGAIRVNTSTAPA